MSPPPRVILWLYICCAPRLALPALLPRLLLFLRSCFVFLSFFAPRLALPALLPRLLLFLYHLLEVCIHYWKYAFIIGMISFPVNGDMFPIITNTRIKTTRNSPQYNHTAYLIPINNIYTRNSPVHSTHILIWLHIFHLIFNGIHTLW